CRAPHGEAGHHRLGADQLSLWRVDRGCAAEARIRPLLRQELFALPRPPHPAPDDPRRAVARGRAVMVIRATVSPPWKGGARGGSSAGRGSMPRSTLCAERGRCPRTHPLPPPFQGGG